MIGVCCVIVCAISCTLGVAIPALVLGVAANKEISDSDDPCKADDVSFNLPTWLLVTGAIMMAALVVCGIPIYALTFYKASNGGNIQELGTKLLPVNICMGCFWVAWAIVGFVILGGLPESCSDSYNGVVVMSWILSFCLVLNACNLANRQSQNNS
jgi:hypothetical protein